MHRQGTTRFKHARATAKNMPMLATCIPLPICADVQGSSKKGTLQTAARSGVLGIPHAAANSTGNIQRLWAGDQNIEDPDVSDGRDPRALVLGRCSGFWEISKMQLASDSGQEPTCFIQTFLKVAMYPRCFSVNKYDQSLLLAVRGASLRWFRM